MSGKIRLFLIIYKQTISENCYTFYSYNKYLKYFIYI